MKKKFTKLMATFVAGVCTLGLQAQTDVTSQYLKNADFETAPICFTVAGGETPNAEKLTGIGTDGRDGNVFAVPEWTQRVVMSNNAAQISTGEYGQTASVANGQNTTMTPATDNAGNGGACLHLSAGWGDKAIITQVAADLPEGKYALVYNVLNQYTKTGIVANYCGAILADGTAIYGTLKTAAQGQWLSETVEFNVATTQDVTISLGFTTSSGSSNDGAKLYVDNVKLLYYGIDKTDLNNAIEEVTELYGDGTGYEAAALKSAIDAAQAVADNTAATMAEIEAAKVALADAVNVYNLAQVSPENPMDMTDKIVNAVVANGTGWNGFRKGKDDEPYDNAPDKVYMDSWNGSGEHQYQVVTGLPAGKYELKAALRGSDGLGGITLYAKGAEEKSTSMTGVGSSGNELGRGWQWVTVTDIIVAADGKLEIGFKCNTDGNLWAGADDFCLTYLGYVESLETEVEEAKSIEQRLNPYYKNLLSEPLSAAESAIANKTGMYDAYINLVKALPEIENALPSLDKVNALIAECKSNATNSTPNEETYKSTFDTAITEAEQAVSEASTVEELENAYSTLNEARKTYVDNAVPTSGYPFDLTFKMVNPDFSTASDEGWTITGTSGNKQYSTQSMEAWNNNNVSITQDLAGLPSGKYTVCVDMISGHADVLNAYLYAKGNSEMTSTPVTAVTSAGNYTTMSNEVAGNTLRIEGVSVMNGALTLGVKDPSTGNGWIVIDNFKLYYTEAIDLSKLMAAVKGKIAEAEALKTENKLNTAFTNLLDEAISKANNVDSDETALNVAYNELVTVIATVEDILPTLNPVNALIAECEKNSTHSIPNTETDKTTFDAAISKAKADVDAETTVDGLKTAYNTLESARKIYVDNAVPNGYPFDLTFKVQNVDFNNGTTGWTCNTKNSNSKATNNIANNQSGDITANYYETWAENSYTGTIEQTVIGLPNGVYSVKAAVFRDQLIAGASDREAVYLFGNEKSTEVTANTGTYYIVKNVCVLDGTLKLGIESRVKNYKWMGIDNVSIAWVAGDAVARTLQAADALNRTIMKVDAINQYLNDPICREHCEEAQILYEGAYESPEEYTDAEEIQEMISTLLTDLNDYRATVLNEGFEDEKENWTKDANGDYIYEGICTYGTGTNVNSAIVPVTGIFGEPGKTLGISAAWTGTMSFMQEVTLPAGKHLLTYDAFNSNYGNLIETNLTGVTVNETTTSSEKTSYEVHVWTSDVIEFEMATAGTVTLTIGYKAQNVGSADVPKLWIDNVKIYSTNVHRRANTEANKYGTICLPFDAELPENMLLYSVTGVDDKDAPTELYLISEESLQAGKAYVYESLDANDIVLTKSGTSDLIESPETNSNGLVGTFTSPIPEEGTSFSGEYFYLLSQNQWVKVCTEYAGQVGVKKYRAYLDLYQIAEENVGEEVVPYTRSMRLGNEGLDGIEEVLNSLDDADGEIYTVTGQRINKPTKGFYIKNGKKYIVK